MNVQRTILSPSADGLRSEYERDFYNWLSGQIEIVRAGEAQRLDLPHLLEELEALGSSERRELANRLETIIEHLLKYEYGLNRDPARGWKRTIRTQRGRLDYHLKQSPSLKRFIPRMLEDRYAFARAIVLESFEEHEETRLEHYRSVLPETLSYTPDQVLDVEWLPSPPPAAR